MASEVSICNRALQKLGAARITALADASVNARACNAAYTEVRDAVLRAHAWRFAIKRAILAPSATAPVHTYSYALPMPADCLRLLSVSESDPTGYIDQVGEYVEWQVEGDSVLSNSNIAYIRYVAQVADPNQMDSLFREVLACRLALEMCEELTQSNSKLQGINEQLKMALTDARRNNAFERRSETPRTDSWILARA